MKKKVDFKNGDQLRRVEDQDLHVVEEYHLVHHQDNSSGKTERSLKRPMVLVDEVERINTKILEEKVGKFSGLRAS